jgi:hypothetical protein
VQALTPAAVVEVDSIDLSVASPLSWEAQVLRMLIPCLGLAPLFPSLPFVHSLLPTRAQDEPDLAQRRQYLPRSQKILL